MPNLPSPDEISAQEAHIKDSRITELIAVHAICFPLACVAVLLRILSRRIAKVRYGADGWFMLAGLCFTAAVMISNVVGLHFGLGRHAVLANPPGFAKTLMSAEVVYNFAMLCIKYSILCLYYRIFFVSRGFTIAVWVIGAFVMGYSIAQTFAAIFQCTPVPALWDPYTHGHCIDTSLAATVMAAFNVATDFAILILPMPILWQMQIPSRRKLQIMGIFLLGGFVCVASVYRCVVIHTLSPSDPTWSDVPTVLWTMAELGVAIVAACLPTFRPLFTWRHGRSGSSPTHPMQETLDQQSKLNLRLQQSSSSPEKLPDLAQLGVLTDIEDVENGKRTSVRLENW